MSTDLRSLLHEAARTEAAEAAREAPADVAAEVERLAALARRRRARVTGGWLAGAAAVVALGVVLSDVLPAADPVPPARPAPWVEETPDDGPVEVERVDGVVVHDGLPVARAMPDGALESAVDGSALVLYGAPASPADDALPPTVLYLVDPDGDVVDVPHALVLDGPDMVSPQSWLPGTRLVLTAVHAPVDTFEVVDLLSGDVLGRVQAEGSMSPDVRFAGDGTTDLVVVRPSGGTVTVDRITAQGDVLASTTVEAPAEVDVSAGWITSEDGRWGMSTLPGERLVTAMTDVSPGPSLPYPDGPTGDCRPSTWVGADVLLRCEAGGAWLARPGTGDLVPVLAGAPDAAAGRVRSAWDVGGEAVLRLRGEDLTRLTLVDTTGEVLVDLSVADLGGHPRVMAGVDGGSGAGLLAIVAGGDGTGPWRLVRVEVPSGRVVELLGEPADPVLGVGMLPLGVVGSTVQGEPRS